MATEFDNIAEKVIALNASKTVEKTTAKDALHVAINELQPLLAAAHAAVNALAEKAADIEGLLRCHSRVEHARAAAKAEIDQIRFRATWQLQSAADAENVENEAAYSAFSSKVGELIAPLTEDEQDVVWDMLML